MEEQVGVTEAKVESLLEKMTRLRSEMQKVIVGQEQIIDELTIALMAGGHCLLEGVPGLAKTLMVRTLAQATSLDFQRIQFTPDLMPTDIIGTEVLEQNQTTGARFFNFIKGPVFANILLADEINRTPPKTQAALLQAMQEFEVSYGGTVYSLERPFFVLATQNPIEQAGTYPLPEAQLDRFLLYLRVGYPSESEELEILTSTTGRKTQEVEPVVNGEDIIEIQALVREVSISEAIADYVNRLVRATRPAETTIEFVRNWVRWGAGPRAGQALILTSKARALLQGRFSVTLDDVLALAAPVLRHRILVNFKAEAEGYDADSVTQALLDAIPVPESPLR